tara:strand:+ start:619 stop:888 length:270 start_codon:yes stop_codon:yes gene_type:complete
MIIESSSIKKFRAKASPEDILNGGTGKRGVSPESFPPVNSFHGKRPIDRGHRGTVSQVKEYEDSNLMDYDHPKDFYFSGLRERGLSRFK